MSSTAAARCATTSRLIEMFGATQPPQSERSPFYPRSPYGVSRWRHIGLPSITAKPMISSSATAFYSIMRAASRRKRS